MYEPVFVVIDKRWDGMLSHDLHAAGYYLNPQFHYSSSFSNDSIMKQGFYNCIGRMVANKEERIKIDLQLESFKHAKGLFGFENAILMRNKKTPADWWDSYGDQCPELKRFAIRVVSLTCSSSGCERNWSAFEMVHSKRRNLLTHKKMDELVFVMCNLKLKHEKEMQCKPSNFDVIQEVEVGEIHDSEWITEEGDLQHNGSTWKEALNPNACHNSDEDVDEVEYNEEFSGSPTHIRSSFQEGPNSSRSRGKRRANQTQRFQLIDEDDEDEHEFANDKDDEGHNDGDYEFANAQVDFQRMGDENAHANDASDDLGARHIDECSFSTGWKPWNKTIDEHDGDGDGDGD